MIKNAQIVILREFNLLKKLYTCNSQQDSLIPNFDLGLHATILP